MVIRVKLRLKRVTDVIAKVLINPQTVSEEDVIGRIRKLGFEVRKISKGYLELISYHY